MSAHTDNRLVATDYTAMRRRVVEVTAGYGRDWVGKWTDVQTLERVALAAIGCGPFDMRDSELERVHELVLDVLGLDR